MTDAGIIKEREEEREGRVILEGEVIYQVVRKEESEEGTFYGRNKEDRKERKVSSVEERREKEGEKEEINE